MGECKKRKTNKQNEIILVTNKQTNKNCALKDKTQKMSTDKNANEILAAPYICLLQQQQQKQITFSTNTINEICSDEMRDTTTPTKFSMITVATLRPEPDSIHNFLCDTILECNSSHKISLINRLECTKLKKIPFFSW